MQQPMLRGGVVQGARRALCAARAPFRPLSAGNRAHPAPPSPLLCERGLPRPPPAGQALSPFAALGLPQVRCVPSAGASLRNQAGLRTPHTREALHAPLFVAGACACASVRACA